MWKCNIVWASWQHPKGGPKEARTFATLRCVTTPGPACWPPPRTRLAPTVTSPDRYPMHRPAAGPSVVYFETWVSQFEAVCIELAVALGRSYRVGGHAFIGGAEVAFGGDLAAPGFAARGTALVVAIQESANVVG